MTAASARIAPAVSAEASSTAPHSVYGVELCSVMTTVTVGNSDMCMCVI